MKKTKLLAITIFFLALSLVLSGCQGAAVANSWPGITVDGATAYVAYNQAVYALDLDRDGQLSETLPANTSDSSLKGALFYHPPVLLEDGYLLTGSYNNKLFEIDTQDGGAREFFTEARNRWIATPLLTENRIFAPNANGSVYAFDLSGDLLWEFETDAAIWATPVMNGSRIYIVSQDHKMYALNAATGDPVWELDLGSAAVNSPALDADGVLYIGTFGSRLLAIDSDNGSIIWETDTLGWVWGSPVLGADGILYLTDLEANLYAIETADGNILWSKQVDADTGITGSALLYNEALFVVTNSGLIASYNLEGERLWKEEFASEDSPVEFHGTPVAAGDNLILVSSIGTETAVFAFNSELETLWQFTPDN
jgi:outer membrane protein assembly factor BamB